MGSACSKTKQPSIARKEVEDTKEERVEDAKAGGKVGRVCCLKLLKCKWMVLA